MNEKQTKEKKKEAKKKLDHVGRDCEGVKVCMAVGFILERCLTGRTLDRWPYIMLDNSDNRWTTVRVIY